MPLIPNSTQPKQVVKPEDEKKKYGYGPSGQPASKFTMPQYQGATPRGVAPGSKFAMPQYTGKEPVYNPAKNPTFGPTTLPAFPYGDVATREYVEQNLPQYASNVPVADTTVYGNLGSAVTDPYTDWWQKGYGNNVFQESGQDLSVYFGSPNNNQTLGTNPEDIPAGGSYGGSYWPTYYPSTRAGESYSPSAQARTPGNSRTRFLQKVLSWNISE